MATKVILPKQGLQMTSGIITKWLKTEGEAVQAGEPLFEMETDKANMEIEAAVSGCLLKIIKIQGEEVPIAEVVAIIGEPGEDITELLAGATKGGQTSGSNEQLNRVATPGREITLAKLQTDQRVFITPRAKRLAQAKGIEISEITGTGPAGLVIEADVKLIDNQAAIAVKATPLAARIAGQNDLSLNDLQAKGTGLGGKITKLDVENAIAARGSKQAMAGTKQ